jgi:hypothetical protein
MLGAVLAGCAGPTGPVVGDWRGYENTRVSYYYDEVEIILDGSPGSTEGVYHYVRTSRENFGSGAGRFLRWTDHWTSRPIVNGGRTLTLVHLADLPNGYFEDYVALPDGVLVPVADPARPDLSAAAMRFAMSPLPRTAYGYGRP